MNILIFGATSGIGRALAKIYAEKGHRLAITGRRLEKLEEIKKEKPENYFPVRHDIRDINSIADIIKESHQKLGQIDLIIVNAGIGKFNLDLEWDICESVIKTNIIGVSKALTESYNYFRKQKKGHLVGITSVASLLGGAANPTYNASKAYQANFLEALWIKTHQSKKNKIYITDIRPGFVDTKLAQGQTFWKANVNKAAEQIEKAIHKKKKIAYITKRWRLVAWLLKKMPDFLLKKLV